MLQEFHSLSLECWLAVLNFNNSTPGLSKEKFGLEFSRDRTQTCWSTLRSFSSRRLVVFSRLASSTQAQVGRLSAALDADVSDQDHPQVILRPHGGPLTPLSILRQFGGHGRRGWAHEPTSGGRGGTNLLCVKAGVCVHRLLVLELSRALTSLETSHILAPVF